jgi:molecular chaperone IbpA
MLLNEDMEMRMIDFAPLTRSSIGFDRLFNLLENTVQFEPVENYPPYNIERAGEDKYKVTLAVAGFAPNELSITTQQNVLLVSGKKAEAKDPEYLYRGIAARPFKRQFSLADYVRVNSATLENGLLSIELVREVPESMKPRQVEISTGKQPVQIEGKMAA